MRSVCSRRNFWWVGDMNPWLWSGKGELASQIVEGQCLIRIPKVPQLLPPPSNRIRPCEHTSVNRSHPLQLARCRPGMRVIEEGAKLKYASGDFWNRKAEFGVEAEDVTDEVICT